MGGFLSSARKEYKGNRARGVAAWGMGPKPDYKDLVEKMRTLDLVSNVFKDGVAGLYGPIESDVRPLLGSMHANSLCMMRELEARIQWPGGDDAQARPRQQCVKDGVAGLHCPYEVRRAPGTLLSSMLVTAGASSSLQLLCRCLHLQMKAHWLDIEQGSLHVCQQQGS